MNEEYRQMMDRLNSHDAVMYFYQKYFPDVKKIAAKYTCGPGQGNADDSIGQAGLFLFEAIIDEKVRPTPEKFGKYLVGRVKRRLMNHVSENFVIPIPHTSRARNNLTHRMLDHYLDIPDKFSHHFVDNFDINEMLESLANDRLSLAVMRLRFKGYNDAEIARIAKIPPMSVFRIRRDFGEKYMEVFGD